jgi:6-phosphogluconolactonase
VTAGGGWVDALPSGPPDLVVLDDPGACARAAAQLIAEALGASGTGDGSIHWVTTGGSAPAAIYRELAGPPLRDRVPWEDVNLWWTDERFVPADHPLSNAKIAEDVLLEVGALSGQSGTGASGADVGGRRIPGAPIPAGNVHPIPTGDAIGRGQGPEWAAARYAETVATAGPSGADDGIPVFDLVLLGVGPDGHILSVFPGSGTFDRGEPVLPVPAPTHVEPHVARVTLHPRVVTVARRILVVATGASKAAILGEVLRGARDVRRLPAQLAVRPGATWILDRAAASALDR